MAIEIQLSRPTGPQDPIVGIDLGTTNSLVAIVEGGVPRVLQGKEGRSLVPSVVSLAEGRPVVGYVAKQKKVRDARHTVFSVKRLIGRSFADLKEVASQLPYEIVDDQAGRSPGEKSNEGEGLVRVKLPSEYGDQEFSAIEISAMILRELKRTAEEALGRAVERAVVTVPAYFNDSQRQATRAAGRLAGWDVLRIINEPTAAALAYGLNRKNQGLIAVFDLGGGTFDVSILKLHDGIFEVLATNGNTALGGDDLDQALVSVCAEEIRAKLGVDVAPAAGAADASMSVDLRAALIEAAEGVKIKLSDSSEATLSIEVAGKPYSRKFTREEFESLARPILERTREPCMNALKDAGLSPSDLTDVVLVGGPTRLKIVQDVARDVFGREPNTSMHPDEVVAAGAAIQADILAGNNKDFLLLDVVPLSLGLETYGGLMSPIIHRNTRIPTVAREEFTTFVDNQTGVDIHVLQGEREKVDDNRSLARFKLKGIEPMPAGLPRVEVTFLVDADGILQVSAKDQHTGNAQSIEVRPSFGLTDEQVEGMLMAGMDHAEEDIAYRQLVEARNKAEPVLISTEKKLPDAERLLPKTDQERIREKLEGLRVALQGKDIPKIQQSARELNEATNRLAELIVTEAIRAAEKK